MNMIAGFKEENTSTSEASDLSIIISNKTSKSKLFNKRDAFQL